MNLHCMIKLKRNYPEIIYKMIKKQKIIIFEGTDKTGKTTIKKVLEEKSNWKYIVLDRFCGSSIVYDKIYNRPDREYMLLRLESDLREIADVYLIYFYCNIKDQIERCKKEKEKNSIIKNIRKAKNLYEDYLDKTYLNHIKINTSNKSIEECCEEIINFVEDKK